jgi:hypothetical protein
MKTFKEFKTELDENAGLIARTVAKAGSKVLAKQKAERDERESSKEADKEESSLGMDMKPKKSSSLSNQKPMPKPGLKTEEKEANAENCSDLPPEEKKKERKLDIRKIRAKR